MFSKSFKKQMAAHLFLPNWLSHLNSSHRREGDIWVNKTAIQEKILPDGKWTWKPLAYREPNNCFIYVQPALIKSTPIVY